MIIRPFDAGFFLLMAVMIGAIVLLRALLRNQPQQRREVVLLTLCVVNIIGFFVYKGFLSAMPSSEKSSGMRSFCRCPGLTNSTGSTSCRCSFATSICS